MYKIQTITNFLKQVKSIFYVLKRTLDLINQVNICLALELRRPLTIFKYTDSILVHTKAQKVQIWLMFYMILRLGTREETKLAIVLLYGCFNGKEMLRNVYLV